MKGHGVMKATKEKQVRLRALGPDGKPIKVNGKDVIFRMSQSDWEAAGRPDRLRCVIEQVK